MNEIIRVNQETMTVSARELHDALEASERFNSWFNRMSAGFIEGEDFTSANTFTVVNNGAQRELTDYQCSVDMAKHICLMSRTDKGKKCRQYLIDLEKAWNSPEQVMARALKLADQTIARLTADNTVLLEDNKRMKPKEEFFDAVTDSTDAVDMKDAANALHMGIGRNNLFKFLREQKILTENNRPYQQYIDRGYFRVIEQKYDKGYGETGINIKTVVYQKGIDYIRKRLTEARDKT